MDESKIENFQGSQDADKVERNEEGETIHDSESEQLQSALHDRSKKVESYAMWVLNKGDKLGLQARKNMFKELIAELDRLLIKMKDAAGEEFENFHGDDE